MKYITQVLVGALTGVLLYLVDIAGSYACIKWDPNGIGLILLLGVFVALAVWNVLYKTTSVGAVLIRAASGALFYSLATLGGAYSGMVIKIEEMLGIGSASQNVQGMITLLLISSGAITSFIAVIIKCIVLCCQRKDSNT